VHKGFTRFLKGLPISLAGDNVGGAFVLGIEAILDCGGD
jgi:hypothetical protein